MRELAISNKRVRGLKRRLRALAAWADRFAQHPPAPDGVDDAGYYWRLPVNSAMVEGPRARFVIQRTVLQEVLRASALLQRKLKGEASALIPVCCITWPTLFDCELLLLRGEEYLQPLVTESSTDLGRTMRITERRLSRELGFVSPTDWNEIGLRDELQDEDGVLLRERWVYLPPLSM